MALIFRTVKLGGKRKEGWKRSIGKQVKWEEKTNRPGEQNTRKEFRKLAGFADKRFQIRFPKIISDGLGKNRFLWHLRESAKNNRFVEFGQKKHEQATKHIPHGEKVAVS